jgi:hypothetical protein
MLGLFERLAKSLEESGSMRPVLDHTREAIVCSFSNKKPPVGAVFGQHGRAIV